MADIYDYEGTLLADITIDYDRTVKGVAHKGLSSAAPENTLPAYKLAKKAGFFYVEADVSFTSDDVPVLLHDNTIDRTSNGTGNVSNFTFDQLQSYDFGSWYSSDFAGTKIPSLKQFVELCRQIILHPYIEIKSTGATQTHVESCVDIVLAAGMAGKVTWISFSDTALGYVKAVDPKARLGYVVNSISNTEITTAQGLLTASNEVFIDCKSSAADATAVGLCSAAGLPLEVWTVDSVAGIKAANAYISGITSNSKIAGKVLCDAYID